MSKITWPDIYADLAGGMPMPDVRAEYERADFGRRDNQIRIYALNELVVYLKQKVEHVRQWLADMGEDGGTTGPLRVYLFMAELELEIVEDYRRRLYDGDGEKSGAGQ